MKAFHWSALGAVSSMVSVLAVSAALMPAPSGTSLAQASFQVISVEDIRAAQLLDAGLDTFETAAGPVASRRMARSAANAANANVHLAALDYDLDAIIQGDSAVPRVILASLPGDLTKVREIDERKAIFFKTVLPLVLRVNEQIVEDRARLWDLDAQVKSGEKLAAVDRLWLAVMAERYNTKRGDVGAILARHDVVPPSLALAQAATESAWGTSRFVREGNAMFGEWTFSSDHKGIVPSSRALGKTHRVRAFDSLYESVFSYVTNLNKHRAYREFRAMRAAMRTEGRTIDGLRLSGSLHHYSERGAAYVDELRTIITGNELHLLDGARLSASGEVESLT